MPRSTAPSTHPAPALPDNAGWQQRSANALWPPCTQTIRLTKAPPLPIASGKGVWLTDYAGQRYLDATSSWWVNLFGHAHPALNAALSRQLDTLPHVMLAGCTHAPAILLAERLAALTGHALQRSFFASDGASAVEIALKMSVHFWRNAGLAEKSEFVCVSNGYHGETVGALGVTDIALFRTAYAPLLAASHVVPSPDWRQARPGETRHDVALRAAGQLEALLEQRHSHIAALILEPLVQCAAGMAMHDAAYVREARRLCSKYGVHLIADEIAVGCGRSGTFFASELAGVWPDFLTLSKGISGGYLPLALVMTRDDIYQAFAHDDPARSFLHSHSYTGNALACTAALATLELFDEYAVLERNHARSGLIWKALETGLQPWIQAGLARHPRRQGMIFAFDIDPARAGNRFAESFHLAAREQGLLLRPIGHTVYLMPPYVIDDDEIRLMVGRTLTTLQKIIPLPGAHHAFA